MAMMPSKHVIMVIWDGTNECFKNNPTSEKHKIVRVILHLFMGTNRKSIYLTEGAVRKCIIYKYI